MISERDYMEQLRTPTTKGYVKLSNKGMQADRLSSGASRRQLMPGVRLLK